MSLQNILQFLKTTCVVVTLFNAHAGIAQNDENHPTLLSSHFLNGQRFFIKMATLQGDTIDGYCDTGGGISMLFQPSIEKFHLEKKLKSGFVMYLIKMKYVPFSEVVKTDKMPQLLLNTNFSLRRHFRKVKQPYLLVPADKGETKEMTRVMPIDMFLGQNYFMQKSWTFDYLNQRVWCNTPLSTSDTSNANVQKIGFKKDENGRAIFGHPSMKIEVDGEVIDVLFDTGATIYLPEKTRQSLNTNEMTLAGSFIAKSIFDRWHAQHPDWKYTEIGNDMNLIEVPQIKIGEYEFGPVLFAERKDEVWSQGMIHSMDKVVKGALGGSALQYFTVTIDYNSELIRFKK